MKSKIEITDLSTEGQGIGRTDLGRVVATPGTYPGDIALVETYAISKGLLRGKLIELIKASSGRCTHPCPHYSEGCPASRLGAYSYEAALSWKQKNLQQTIRRMGGVDIEVPPVVASSRQWGYRERIDLGIDVFKGIFRIGYQSESGLIPILDCQLAEKTVREAVNSFAERAYQTGEARADQNQNEENGMVGRILFRGNRTGGIVIVLFLNRDRENLASFFENILMSMGLTGWEIRIVDSLSERAYRSNILRWHGNSSVTIKLAGSSATTSPLSFSQVNRVVAELIVAEVLTHIDPLSKVLDLFGGWGMFGLSAADKGAEVLVVDSNGDSLKAGGMLAKALGLDVRFERGDLDSASGWANLPRNVDVCIVDPPRKGLTIPAIEWLNLFGAERLVYVSCHPAALSRDSKALSNYRLDAVKPFDMFLQTPDLEIVAVLHRLK